MVQTKPWVTGDPRDCPSLKDWGQKIIELYRREYVYHNDEKNSLRKMARTLQYIQGLNHCASYFYSVKECMPAEVSEVAQSDVQLRTLQPELDTAANSQERCDYWCCIDLDGVTLFGKPRNANIITFKKRFLYFSGAQKCVTKWGAKEFVILLQLREGDHLYCSLFMCKMALDIAYCMFRLSKIKRRH